MFIYLTFRMLQHTSSEVEFLRGLEISRKIFSRRYELSRGFFWTGYL